jgi:preprotein translocase subunit YajC
MNSFISPLFQGAQLLMGASDVGGASSSPASLISTFVPFGLVILIFYFLIIRPQNKKQKDTERMLSAIKKGDQIVTIGGIHGTISALKDGSVVVKVDDSTKIEFSRSAIASVVADPSKAEEAKISAPKKTKAAKAEKTEESAPAAEESAK